MPCGTYLLTSDFAELGSFLNFDICILDLPVGEAEPLEQELPSVLHALVVAAPVLQSIVTELLHNLQPLLAAAIDRRMKTGFKWKRRAKVRA